MSALPASNSHKSIVLFRHRLFGALANVPSAIPIHPFSQRVLQFLDALRLNPSFLVVGTSCLIVLTTSPALETEVGQTARSKERAFPSCRGREGFTLVTAFGSYPPADFPSISSPVAAGPVSQIEATQSDAMPGGPSILPLEPPLRRGEDLCCSVGKKDAGQRSGPWCAAGRQGECGEDEVRAASHRRPNAMVRSSPMKIFANCGGGR
jgi:hypothetical protein